MVKVLSQEIDLKVMQCNRLNKIECNQAEDFGQPRIQGNGFFLVVCAEKIDDEGIKMV